MDIPPTPAQLSEALRQGGVSATVRDVAVEIDRTTILSRVLRLRLDYQDAVMHDGAPRGLILKTGLPRAANAIWNSGRQEVAFYTQVAPHLPDRTVPRCFGARFDADSNEWHLLLEDLAASHALATPWPLPPTRAQCEAILGATARFHAGWWNDKRVGVSVGRWLDAEGFKQHRERMAKAYEGFTDRLGDMLPRARRELFERFLDSVPRLFRRVGSHHDVTLLHGDAHVWNFFLPQGGGGLLPPGGGDDVRIFDWDGWRPGVATTDLAYMMAVHWYPDRRAALESSLLDHYHDVLLGAGVDGYGRAALAADYRFSVLTHIMTPVWQVAADIPPVVWWNNFERVLLAVDDLGCRELLG